MVPPPRAGTFSPSPAQSLHTGTSHSPHPSQNAALGGSPVTGSPTGTNTVSKIVVAQVFVLLSSIKEEKDDPSKWEQLRKLIDENGMEVYTKYFTRLVASSASQIFPGLNRPGGNAGSYQVLLSEMQKISHDPEQARRIAESIELGTEDIFRDFDLSTFMEHFKLDALEKTILALAFKLGSRSDLKTKADAILSTNFPTFTTILSKSGGDHADIDPAFVSLIVDRFIQLHPPNFTANAKADLAFKVAQRYESADLGPPVEILGALDLLRILADRPASSLANFAQKTGADFTRDEDVCVSYLQSRQGQTITEEQVATALVYTAVGQTYIYSPSVLVSALRRVVPATFRWQDVIDRFDQPGTRITPPQFLRLYNALVPIARDDSSVDIQRLWGGTWENPDTQLSFLSGYASQTPEQLDATTVPGIQPTIATAEYAEVTLPEVRERAAVAVKHPLVSLAAASAIIHVALQSQPASSSIEARRLFQTVVIPNLDIFVVSAALVPKPWSATAADSFTQIFNGFLYNQNPNTDFVFDTLWRKDKQLVTEQLITAHAYQPGELPTIFQHCLKHGWLNDLIYLPNGFGLDLVAYAHGQRCADLALWAKNNAERSTEIARPLLQFLIIKSELEAQRPDGQPLAAKANVPLKVQTVAALLSILEDYYPTASPSPELVSLQRQCIAIYPRLINYGEGFDDIIEESEKASHTLPQEANTKMEEHFKKMYSNEIEVREVVRIMEHYKHSRDKLEQDIFACMINSLFEEYSHFGDYPLEALATTAVLFGGMMSHKLISDLPLKVGLGMILEAVRDHKQDQPMFKFGMQALMQLYARFREWPGFCRQLLQCKSLQGTEAWKKASDVVREAEEEVGISMHGGEDQLTNGNGDDGTSAEQPPFTSINIDPLPPHIPFEDPDVEAQGKIQFVLNNITANTLQSMFLEIRPMVDLKHQQWFASHLVEERAKMQPNYHKVYLQLVSHFEDKALWASVLRETYVSVARMLNSEATMQNSTERTHLKNLGGWLGLLTLARDKPIRHRNIAFKQLLIEAHDTKRLIVVIPFVCKVLSQGEQSNVFKPPNPWLMDIIHFLIDLYHNAELKLNLKFEIEVLCQTLSIDHKSIEPSGEILNRVAMEVPSDLMPDALDTFDSLSLNGLGHAGVGAAGGIAGHGMVPGAVPNSMVTMIPELITKVHVPPVSEMVISAARLEEIVRNALVHALQDIIQQVVDRSVAIAAIATQQMVHKDFATEPDENRFRTAAISMAKATAGSLALVTSKEPLRANFTNYMRTLSNDLPQGLPEGTIIMCVNSNLDFASSVIEKATEERAAYEIEEMIEPELEVRRRHRMQRPNEPFMETGLSRWAMTIPNPYKLNPSISGLNADQMAIYDDFARHPRPTTANNSNNSAAHAAQASENPRSLANDVLQDPYNPISAIPSASESPSVASMQQSYPHVHGGNVAGNIGNTAMNMNRPAGPNLDVQHVLERVRKLTMELQRVASDAVEEHFSELPRPHPVLDLIDALIQTIIKAQQSVDDFAVYASDNILPMLFSPVAESTLALESFVQVLESLRKMVGIPITNRIHQYFSTQPGAAFLRLPLIQVLMPTGLLDWTVIDNAMAASLKQRKENSIVFFTRLLELTLIHDSQLVIYYAHFFNSLSEAWAWIEEDPEVPGGQEFKTKILTHGAPPPLTANDPSSMSGQENLVTQKQDQIEYVFEEWVLLSQRPNIPENISFIFVEQMRARGIITNRDDLFLFTRFAIDKSVERFDIAVQSGESTNDGFVAIDSVAKFVAIIVQAYGSEGSNSSSSSRSDAAATEGRSSPRADLLDSILALAMMILNYHHLHREDLYNQRVFFRFFSMLLVSINNVSEHLSDTDRNEILRRFAVRFNDLGPAMFPFFVYGWVEIIKHRIFMPSLLRAAGDDGWAAYTKILKQFLTFTGEQLKISESTTMARELLRASLKLLLVIYHDFPDYLAANHVELVQCLPPYLVQPISIVLFATPSSIPKPPDPALPGLRLDQMEEASIAPYGRYQPGPLLSSMGLAALLDQALENGPSEEVVAHVKYAMSKTETKTAGSTWGRVPIASNVAVVDAVVAHIGNHVATRASNGGPMFTASGADMATLSMILHELTPEGRYYMICSIVNQLRYPNAHTNFFALALLEIFGHDMADPEETEIREQICRVLFERIVNYWPQPWGLLAVITELVKNDKFFFFDLPFIKAAPELSERFASLVNRS
ncbi:CCR4-NOT core subunit cdc39 [Sporothrix curviconia]|uniref:CCR4-NOT core subunit cdc39 n=1 Tax=Sporothrix curviconia TaxID=1260050 RepID=A0ABP0BX13_9PEZI